MKLPAAAFLVLTTAACGVATPATQQERRPPAPAITQLPNSTATPAATDCRLPVWLFDQSTHLGSGFFLRVAGPGTVPSQPATSLNSTVASYVRSADRWVPVPRSLVAPDGKHYAYNDGSGDPEVDRVHVVDVATGADRVVAQGSDVTGYEVLDFEADGLYVGRPNRGPSTGPGLWRLAPETGAATVLDTTRRWRWISGGHAYVVEPNSTDPVATQGAPEADTMFRLDIGTRSVQQWFRQRGVFLNMRGFDWEGHPVLTLGDTLADLVVVTSQNEAQPIVGGSRDVTFTYTFPSLVADSEGFWFGADQGVYRYTAAAGFRLLWSNPNYKAVLPMVVGGCA